MDNENQVVKQKSNKGLVVLIIILILIVLGLSGYLVYDKFITKDDTKTNEVTQKETTTNDSNNNSQSTDTNNYKNGDYLNQTDLNTISEYLNKSGANAFLIQPYNLITEIDMESLLKESNIVENGNEYCDLIGYCEGALYKVNKSTLEEYLKIYTGKTVNDFKMDSIYYNKENKFYLLPSPGPSSLFGVTVENGRVNEDGNYVIDYTIDVINENYRRVTLKKVETNYQFISNIKR